MSNFIIRLEEQIKADLKVLQVYKANIEKALEK